MRVFEYWWCARTGGCSARNGSEKKQGAAGGRSLGGRGGERTPGLVGGVRRPKKARDCSSIHTRTDTQTRPSAPSRRVVFLTLFSSSLRGPPRTGPFFPPAAPGRGGARPEQEKPTKMSETCVFAAKVQQLLAVVEASGFALQKDGKVRVVSVVLSGPSGCACARAPCHTTRNDLASSSQKKKGEALSAVAGPRDVAPPLPPPPLAPRRVARAGALKHLCARAPRPVITAPFARRGDTGLCRPF